MMQTLLGFIRKELTQSLRDPRMRIILVIMPLIQLSLFGFAISNEVKNIRLGVQYTSKDYVLEHIYTQSIASGWFVPVQSTISDPHTLIEDGVADAVLVPPAGGFSRALERGDAKLQFLIDAINVTKAQSINKYMHEIVESAVSTDTNLKVETLPITIKPRVLFNPDLETSVFMVPGIMCMLMVITTMVLANLAIVREKEMGTFEMLIAAPVSRSEIIYGKTIPYVILGMSNFPLILALAILLFGVPMRGSYLILFIAALAFVCMAVALGSLISTFCKNQQQATLAGFLFIFPIIMLSGLMFPVENMPNSIKWLALIDPLYHYIGLMRNIMLKGGGTQYVVMHIAILVVMAIITVTISLRRFHTTL